jgi:Regulator of chromosome condensation (RCC1) repeat
VLRHALVRRLAAASTVALVSTGCLGGIVLAAQANPVSIGKVASWGYDGSLQNEVPASLDGKNVVAIADGEFHSLALTSDGVVTSWGTGNNMPFWYPNQTAANPVPASLTGKTVRSR